MLSDRERQTRRMVRVLAAAGSVLMIVAILWIDIATGWWQDLVILSGLAAGLVTFLLTVLVLDRVVARSTARRWAPVNRLALTEFLHGVADEDRSEIAHGRIEPRALPTLPDSTSLGGTGAAAPDLASVLRELRETIVAERCALAAVLGRWAQFLASSGDNEAVLQHVAEVAWQLDRVRDATLEFEAHPGSSTVADLNAEIERCNRRFLLLVEELRAAIVLDTGRRASALGV